jgi:hypothetical protein
MTLYGATDPQVCGQPMSPFFGQQQNVRYTGAPVIPSPNASPNSGPQVTMQESMSRGALPMNADATAVSGVSTGAQNPTPLADCMSNGCGTQVNGGVAVPGTALNPSTSPAGGGGPNGAENQQVFGDGQSLSANLQTGPDNENTETLTSGPVSGATHVNNLTLGNFQG